ncbi:MAG: hypothetical protein KA099_00800 [Alphaproteobacteria bacterium]|nr:hypothetical protein [Alphaproteobacteria bacterium]MBP7758140.1 hypothetical protein [Alphaproteobacteria bacterium]MBP7761427.1 hypothetical protein [Alphaproteobacteria bacterium]MBP7903838.1 hypothetical protein [Alphaproteobacteria bacterium]
MGKLTEYMTAAGLSALLLVGEASGQEAKKVDLKTIDADRVVIQTNGRSVFNTVSMPTISPTTPTSQEKPSKPPTIENVEDCLTASSSYVKTAAPAAPAAATGTAQRGTAAERIMPQRGSTATGTASQAFIATCYNNGREVAKITFSHGKDPMVELITNQPKPASR